MPETKFAVTVVLAEFPLITEPDVGLRETEKSNGALTVKVYAADLIRVPAVPITDMLYVPVRVELVVDIVNAELHVGLQDVGLNEQVAPDGSPEQLKFTDCAGLLTREAVTVVLTEFPRMTEPEFGLDEIEKSNTGLLTVTVIVADVPTFPAAS